MYLYIEIIMKPHRHRERILVDMIICLTSQMMSFCRLLFRTNSSAAFNVVMLMLVFTETRPFFLIFFSENSNSMWKTAAIRARVAWSFDPIAIEVSAPPSSSLTSASLSSEMNSNEMYKDNQIFIRGRSKIGWHYLGTSHMFYTKCNSRIIITSL